MLIRLILRESKKRHRTIGELQTYCPKLLISRAKLTLFRNAIYVRFVRSLFRFIEFRIKSKSSIRPYSFARSVRNASAIAFDANYKLQ